jgi:hypothetical protein
MSTVVVVRILILLATAIGIVVLLAACSEHYMRELELRDPKIKTDLTKYCIEYPKDSACQGANSK